MKKTIFSPYYYLCALFAIFAGTLSPGFASDLGSIQTSAHEKLTPIVQPSPPHLAAKGYILIDSNSGKILAEKNSTKRLPPASLTKMMTLYVISHALKNEQIHLTDKVRISRTAWKTGGSKMFVKEGQRVSVENLLKGIIVDSGNDACVAMAEHLAGNEASFAKLMNQQAKRLGMNQSHFTDSTGLPHPNHFTTAQDLAILGRALIKDFPEYYHWYKQKWFSFNGIRQPNRNRLLWRNKYVDGVKTGHTKEAGYCLVSSAKKNDMRLLSVVLGSPNDASRAQGSQNLLVFGFRFYETHRLYSSNKQITTLKVWKGEQKSIAAGIQKPLYITIPTGQYKQLSVNMASPEVLEAPLKKNQVIGQLVVSLNNKIIAQRALISLNALKQGGLLSRMGDSIGMRINRMFGKSKG